MKSFLSPPLCQVAFVTSYLCDCEYVCHVPTPTSCTNIKKVPIQHSQVTLFLVWKWVFIYLCQMKENICILEILKQISDVKSNVKMKTSKCLIILDLGKHISEWTFNVEMTAASWLTLGSWWSLKIICNSSFGFPIHFWII